MPAAFALPLSTIDAMLPPEEDWLPIRARLASSGKLTNTFNARDAIEAGCSLHHLAFAASQVARHDPEVGRRIREWMADCAARVVSLFEKEQPSDTRVRHAVAAARSFASGAIDDPVRLQAKRAAQSAAPPYGPARYAAMSAVHSLAGGSGSLKLAMDLCALDAARAQAYGAEDIISEEALVQEEGWQRGRLAAWLDDLEPTPVENVSEVGK